MDRPQCKTCPHARFIRDNAEELTLEEVEATDDSDMWTVECHRYPPFANHRAKDLESPNYIWPSVWAVDSCGEHPDFPAYIKNLAPKDHPDIDKPIDKLSISVRAFGILRDISRKMNGNHDHVITPRELSMYTKNGLHTWNGVGNVIVNEFEELLNAFGLSLSPDETE